MSEESHARESVSGCSGLRLDGLEPSAHSLTQLDVAHPDALLALLQDLLKVDAGEAAGAARHQDGCHAHELGARRDSLLLRG